MVLKHGRLQKLTEEQVGESVQLYRQGLSCGAIARYFDVSRQAMWALLKARGVQMRRRERNGEDNHFYRGGSAADDHAQNMVEYALRRGLLSRPMDSKVMEAVEGKHYVGSASCGHSLCGCDGVSACCERCPLPHCRFELTLSGIRSLRAKDREAAIRTLAALGLKPPEIASAVGVSKRMVYRALEGIAPLA